ncbi:MAG TPA: MFS transporter, partial [Desulfosarcina sp.]|nr:MFS transporter [Desulfosarcina sp.]
QMRLRSVVFILTMTVGAAVYDPDLMSRVMAVLGSDRVLSQGQTLRFPVYLTFVLALFTLAAVLGMDEVRPDSGERGSGMKPPGGSATEAFRRTLETGGWILRTPFVLAVILFGMLFDGILRMVITLASQYYRMVSLPESTYGILGSVMAMAGLFIPRLARRIAETHSAVYCLWTTAAVALSGLAGMAFFWPYAGLVPALVAFSALYMVGFYLSYFVNRHTSSSRRATVLSFKGLAYNLSYGLIGMIYAGALEARKAALDGAAVDTRSMENFVFKETFLWFPVALAAGLAAMAAGMAVYRARRR